LEVDEFDFENEGGFARNFAADATVAVGAPIRDDDGADFAAAHGGEDLVPAGDDAAGAELEIEGSFVGVVAVVEGRAVEEGGAVVGFDPLAGAGALVAGAGALDDVAQAGGSNGGFGRIFLFLITGPRCCQTG